MCKVTNYIIYVHIYTVYHDLILYIQKYMQSLVKLERDGFILIY